MGRLLATLALLIAVPLSVTCAVASEPFASPESNTCDDSGIYALFFINDNEGWAVGECGTILKTSDGAENWKEQESGTIALLKSAYFIDQNRGWIVGVSSEPIDNSVLRMHQGIILSTDDGGVNWNTLASGFEHWLTDVFFVDDNLGWVVGRGTIIRTDDGGNSWLSRQEITGDPVILDPLKNVNLEAVHFIDNETGWAVGNRMVKTEDGGEHWKIQEWAGNSSDVQFVDHNRGYILTSNSILKTINGGETWEEYTILDDNPEQIRLTDSHFIDSDTGWAVGWGSGTFSGGNVGSYGAVFETNDGGVTWRPIWESGNEGSRTGYSASSVWAFDTESVLVGLADQDSLILKIKE